MPIAESQLDTWSHQGSTTQSAATYETIKNALRDPAAPFSSRSFDIFLQGSYGNDTNIYADSDVDVVIALTDIFYADTRSLNDADKARYEANRSPGNYSFATFKREVTDWLTHKFGNGVRAGKKAIYVPGNGSRRDADVLACAEHRRYQSYAYPGSSDFHEGIVFWTSAGEEIVNFPKQHSRNCTTKHQATSSWFKPNVRVLKNMRNAMVRDGYVAEGRAPSYFLEGMLWNVPNTNFGGSYQSSFINSMNWLRQCDPTQLACANDLHWLLRDGSSVCWNRADFQAFLDAASRYWSR